MGKVMTEDKTDRSRDVAILFAAIIGGIFLTALLFLLIYEIRGVLPPFIYAFVIVYLLRPLVNVMVSRNIPRLLAVSIVYILVIFFLILTFVFVVPMVINQISELATNFPAYSKGGLKSISDLQLAFYKIHLPREVESLFEEMTNSARNSALIIISKLPETTFSFFGGIFYIILAPILAFYILKDLPDIKRNLIEMIPLRFRGSVEKVLKEIDFAVGGYLRGQVLISIIVGTIISIYLLIIGVKFAILLGMLAGVLNIIPYFGPIVGGAVAATVALFDSPRLALFVIIGMIAIQQLDSAVISPTIMRHTVNLHPAIVIFALLVGGTLFGFLGLIMAIPVAAVAKALLLHFVYSQPVETAEEG
ncbi:MAG TPA: AI-2E family transporter [Actinobacteria bacterium]|nr:AI-2E family transporter [Actinomycetota bacterium]